MIDYSKQIENEKDKLAQLEKKLAEYKVQSANKIAEMTEELKQQSEILASVLELERIEKLTQVKLG